MQRPAAPARVTRGLAVALVGLGIAAAGHASAGGGVVVSPLAVVLALLVSGACILLSQRRWTAGRLLVALVGMQLAAHAVLWFDAGGRTVDPRLGALAGPDAHAHAGATPASSAAMLLAHAAAVVLAAVLLAAADAALGVLQALARRILGSPVRPLAGAPRAGLTGLRTVVVRRVLELGAVGRRGPPRVPAPA